MSKLFKLKEWLTVDETAKHLTSVLGEEVIAADIFRLALDGHLTLSVHLPNLAAGNLGKVVGYDDAERIPALGKVKESLAQNGRANTDELVIADCIGNDQFVNWSEKVTTVRGVWDLAMLASERLDVEHVYHQLTDGPQIELIGLDGTFLKQGNVYCRLVESDDDNEYMPGSLASRDVIASYIYHHDLSEKQVRDTWARFDQEREKFLEKKNSSPHEDNFYIAGGLPKDSVYVVRTSAIMDFLSSIEDKPAQHEKPLTTKERNSMLTLIAALCAEAKVDYTQRGIATALAKSTETLGSPLTDDTIRSILKQVKALIG